MSHSTPCSCAISDSRASLTSGSGAPMLRHLRPKSASDRVLNIPDAHNWMEASKEHEANNEMLAEQLLGKHAFYAKTLT